MGVSLGEEGAFDNFSGSVGGPPPSTRPGRNLINLDINLDIDIPECINVYIYSNMPISRYISTFIRVLPGGGDGGGFPYTT